jgi:hypothetical protein
MAADAEGKAVRSFPSIGLVVEKNISAESVHAALDRVFDMVGCPTCGLNGVIDFHISVINPIMRDEIKGVVGLTPNIRG